MAQETLAQLCQGDAALRNQAFASLETLLNKITLLAHRYDAVVAEGHGATIPALGVSTLVTELRYRRGLSAPIVGHIKSTSGPDSVYPYLLPSASYEGGRPRCLLVTEQIHSGYGVQWALCCLRGVLPVDTAIDVATIADRGRNGIARVRDLQETDEQLIVGYTDSVVGNYFWSAENISDDMRLRALALGHAVAGRMTTPEES